MIRRREIAALEVLLPGSDLASSSVFDPGSVDIQKSAMMIIFQRPNIAYVCFFFCSKLCKIFRL